MTLYEYFQTPETVLPQELIYGAVRVAESPSPIHQHIVGNLFLILHQHLFVIVNYGVRECWLVHQLTGHVSVLRYTDRRLASETSHRREERIKSGVLPEFEYSLAMIFGAAGL